MERDMYRFESPRLNSLHDKYRFEHARLNSFKNWPVSFIDPLKLASAGFYYTGKADVVCCFECNISILNWVEGDRPIAEHQRWSENCKFIRKIPCGNIPLGKITKNALQSHDVCGLYDIAALNKNYDSYDDRVESFRTWIKKSPNPKILARYGFVYAGTYDKTFCHACIACVENWQPTDDPLVKHALKSRDCPFLDKTVGKKFIDKLINEFGTPKETNCLQSSKKM